MIRRFFLTSAALCGVVLVSTAALALAQSSTLTADDITRLLTGNTVEGKWDGITYRSYFDPDGTTIFVSSNAEKMLGKWRVNAGSQQYETFFDAIGWTGYSVLRTDTGFAWQSKGTLYPFTVLEGRDLDF